VTGLVIWLIAAVLLAIGELVTPGMFFLGRSPWRRSAPP